MSTTHREGRWRAEGPERGTEARSTGVPRGVGSGEGRRSPSPVWESGGIAPRKFWNLTVQICSFFPRFQDILLLHITHSSKVNCTLCVRKHTNACHDKVELFHLLADGGKIPPYGMVEFFHPLSDGVKIPPCWWRFWTTIIGGIFHLFPLQCGYTKEKRYTNK